MTTLITRFGALGVFLLMVPESACIPIPSEVMLLFSGFAVHQGWMNLPLANASDRRPTPAARTIRHAAAAFVASSVPERPDREAAVISDHTHIGEKLDGTIVSYSADAEHLIATSSRRYGPSRTRCSSQPGAGLLRRAMEQDRSLRSDYSATGVDMLLAHAHRGDENAEIIASHRRSARVAVHAASPGGACGAQSGRGAGRPLS
jgi:hypothetical protein